MKGPRVQVDTRNEASSLKIPLARTMLDTFAGIEEGRNNRISIDYDTTNVAIENLFHANFEEFRQYRCYQLEWQNPGEEWRPVKMYRDCKHPKHLVSNAGRLYLMIDDKICSPSYDHGDLVVCSMNSCHHVLSKVVHYTFKEEALEGRRVIHNTDNKEDNAVKNLKTVSLEEFKKLPIHVQLEYDRFEGNQIQEDLLGGLWRPKASGHSSVEAPTGYEASNYGRYCSALTGDMVVYYAIQ